MNETKEYILKTSLLLFLQKSYKDVTMKEIVEKTGLSKGAFYHYFKSKEELFKDIADMFIKMGVIDYSTFPKNSLEAFYKNYTEYIGTSFKEMYKTAGTINEEKTSLNFFLIMFEAVSRFPEFLEFELKQYNESLTAWMSIIKKAKRSREIRSESSDKQLADMFLYCTDGVFIRFVNNDNKQSYEKELMKAFDTIYENLKI